MAQISFARLLALSPGAVVVLATVIPVPATAASSYRLPTQCSTAAVCSPVGGASITDFNIGNRAAFNIVGNTGIVQQLDSKAILNWKDFNLGPDSTLRFVRVEDLLTGKPLDGASFTTLNRIYQGSKSVIEGKIEVQAGQNGAIYLINQNGILFKGTARVDVNTLVASALNIKDEDFLSDSGIFNAGTRNGNNAIRPAFFWEGSDAIEFGRTSVEVADGALINAQKGGAVLLLAPNVKNSGTIITEEGQVVLAAGAKVYIAPPDQRFGDVDQNGKPVLSEDSPYRGLTGILVEVDPFEGKDAAGANVRIGGEAINEVVGKIVAAKGNATLVGLTVNQKGRITATTSVNQKGSIRLLARQGGVSASTTIEKTPAGVDLEGVPILSALETGTLIFGAGSVTEVLAEPRAGSNDVLTDNQNFHPSTIQGVGKKIVLEEYAKILAPGGHVTLSAQAIGNQFQLPVVGQANDSRIYQAANSVIDVSGTRDVSESIERYFKILDLRANELRDNPLNRDNPVLRGEEVLIDLRNLPDNTFADLSPFLSLIERTAAEKLAVGGTVKLRSEGDIVLREDSSINISGGVVNITEGYGGRALLVSGGAGIDVIKAKGDRVYQALFNDKFITIDPKWGVIETYSLLSHRPKYLGYVEGKDAGKVSLLAHAYALEGKFVAGVTLGENQRLAAPKRGELVIGDEGQDDIRNFPTPDYKTPDVSIRKSFDFLASSFNDNTDLTQERAATTLLSADLLNRSELGKIAVYSNGKITVESNSGLVLPEFGELNLTGSQIDVRGSLSAVAGTINLKSQVTSQFTFTQSNIDIAPGAVLSTAGKWVNDNLGRPDLKQVLKSSAGQAIWDGGSVNIEAYDGINLSASSAVDVGGSAYVSADRKLTLGNGGSIALTTNRGKEALSPLAALNLQGELRAQAPGKGGSLTLRVPALTIGTAARGVAGELLLDPKFFSGNGFGKYTLEGRDSVVVAAGATLAPTVARRRVNNQVYFGRATGSDIREFSKLEIAPLFLRQAVDLTLQARNTASSFADTQGTPSGWLTVERGARISVDPGGSVYLGATSHQLEVQGQISAPAGKITLAFNSSKELDYDPAQAIWIGKDARLSATGAFIATPSNNGLLIGKVLDAGSITIDAQYGYVVAEQGAVLDVSAVAATLPIVSQGSPVVRSTRIAGNAGLIDVRAREGGLLDAELRGQSAGALGGRLALTLDHGGKAENGYPGSFTNDTGRLWKIELTQNVLSIPAGLKPGNSIDALAPGRLHLGIERALQGGFDQLAFNAEHAVAFKGDVTIPFGQKTRAITINAPVIESDGGKVALAAGYINLGNQSKDLARQVTQVASGGTGELGISAGHVDLTGHFALQGFKSANIDSDGDVRLVGVVKDAININTPPTRPEGSFVLQGDLQIRARQVVATTLSQYAINVGGQATFARHGSPSPVLSAGSDILVKAKSIVFEGAPGSGDAGGAFKAPLGSITLDADSITLGEGSIVSVSGENQVIPFGTTTSTGRVYLYGKQTIDKPLEKRIELVGKDVQFKTGATFDVSGGGDLLAYEFIQGLGGSFDVLSPGVSPNTYAVLPSYINGRAAPIDSQFVAELGAANVAPRAVGASVFLNGGSGLDAGYYTLLPARYALLPGAFLVTQSGSQYQDLSSDKIISQVAGGKIVSGNFAALNRDGTFTQTSRTAGFLVEPGALARTRSEYLLTLGSNFFSGKGGQVPGDAGRIVFNASQSLLLAGSLAAQRAAGFRGAEVDIASRKLALVSPGGAALAAADTDAVRLDVAALNKLGADSFLIGGTRSTTDQGKDVNVVAERVIVANDAQNAFTAPEIVLAATQQVLVQSGSAISAGGAGTSRAGDINITNSDGNGALLRVANGLQADVTRKVVSGAQGDLTVEANAVLSAGGAINLDSTRETKLNGTLNLGLGAGLALASGSIGVGDVQGLTRGLNFDQTAFGALLARTGDLRLTSYNTIDFYGKVDGQALLGGNAAPDLRLRATGLAGFAGSNGANADVTLSGNRVTLSNHTSTVVTPFSGNGKLTILAQELRTGDGQFALTGFDEAKLQASTQIVAAGKGGLNTAAKLTLDAPRVTAEAGADFKFKTTTNTLTIASSAGQAAALARNVPSARLAFEGAQVNIDGLIDLPSGKIDITATQGDLNLNSGAVVRAAGQEEFLFDAAINQPGGTVSLTASNKAILGEGSLVDVSATGADAGTLKISANELDVQGNLKGDSTAGAEGDIGSQGRFELTVGKLAELGGLAEKLDAGGFKDSVRVNVVMGNTGLASGKKLSAREIQIAADGGSISIAGTLDATHARGGSIALAAKDDVTLLSGASLLAEALDAGRQGGLVEISAKDGFLDLQSGSSIKVAGGASPFAQQYNLNNGRLGGQVWLRTGVDDKNIRVKSLAASVSGTEYLDATTPNNLTLSRTAAPAIRTATYLEAVQRNIFNQALLNIDTARINTLQSGITTFYTNLVKPSSVFRVVPGLEIVNTGGDITLANNWNFGSRGTTNGPTPTAAALRFGSERQAGVLTLRAAGNVNINAALSDGFRDTTGTADTWYYDTSLVDSWGYRIGAGSNFNAAAPLAVTGGRGKVTVAAGQLVRTGSGFIDVAAGQDIAFAKSGTGNATRVGVLYSAGRISPTLPNFTAPQTGYFGTNRRQAPNYTNGGGNIRLTALRDIRGEYYEALGGSGVTAEPIINQWLFRFFSANQVNPQTTWWSRFDRFRQGVATLGGGDITVEAKGDIDKLWLLAPTNARLGGEKDQAPNIDNLLVQGGGDIIERAGGKVENGLIFLGQGQGKIVAGDTLGTRVALQDATVQLLALNDVTVLDAFNPTARDQQTTNSSGTSTGVSASFNSYGDNAALRVLSRAGGVEFGRENITENAGNGEAYPGLLSVRAPQGNIRIDDALAISLFPNAFGGLDLIAGKDILFANLLSMSDTAVSNIPGITAPAPTSFLPTDITSNTRAIDHDPKILHSKDTKPVRVYAGVDIASSREGAAQLALAKPGVLRAGRDVMNLGVDFQNLAAGDVSQLLAGRDVIYRNKVSAEGTLDSLPNRINISGPGRLDVVAGRHIDLGTSDGIVSVGDALNPYLGNQGASLTVVTGLGANGNAARQPDYAAFAAQYLVKDSQALAAYYRYLSAIARKEIKAELESELASKGLDSFYFRFLSASAREEIRANLGALIQPDGKVDEKNIDGAVVRAVVNRLLENDLKAQIELRNQAHVGAFERENLAAKARVVFFNELREAGVDVLNSKGAKRGTDAAALLFPSTVNGQAARYEGDLNLYFSQIKTTGGGDIEIFVPGGLLNVGLASSGDISKIPANLGIISVRDGDVSAYVRGDILVNQSRIFTLGGNDITLWSDQSNIDAGKGSKSVSGAPAPRLVIKDGRITFDISGSVSGSGIATVPTQVKLKEGDAYLVAPNGEINASDAGIVSGGNLLVAAPVVLGGNNIKVGGESSGVPVASSGVTGASFGANTNDSSKTTEQTKTLLASTAEQNRRLGESLGNFRPSFISVEVVGFGSTGQPSN